MPALLKVALIGTGFIATRKHLPAWTRLGKTAKLAALCDVDLQRGREVAGKAGIPNVYEDVGEMLDKESPDAVDICTPPKTHAALAVSALRAGAHVLVEKPMAVGTEDCDAIIAAAEEADRKVCVSHSDLFYPSFVKARKLVDEGAIGEFSGMRIFLSTPMGYMTALPDHWANKLPGGVIGESGPHVVYMTLAFVNPISEVEVRGRKVNHQYPWSPYDDYRLDLIGQNAVSSVTLSYTTNHWAAQVDLWGSEGLVRVDLESQNVIRQRRTELTPWTLGATALSEAGQTARSAFVTAANVMSGRFKSTHDSLVRKFCESIQKGTPPPVTPQEGREAVRVMDLIVAKIQSAEG